MPKVLNKRVDVIPDDAVYVGRPSKWGNPYRVGNWYGTNNTRKNAIQLFHNYLMNHLELVEAARKELKGKDLVCWCHTWNGEGPNPMYCHADIWLEIVNGRRV